MSWYAARIKAPNKAVNRTFSAPITFDVGGTKEAKMFIRIIATLLMFGGIMAAENERVPVKVLLMIEQPQIAEILSKMPGWQISHKVGLETVKTAIDNAEYDVLIAISPLAENGVASKAIKYAQEKRPAMTTIYHGWDYRTEVSGKWAAQCGANGMIVGGMAPLDIFQYCTSIIYTKRMGLIPKERTVDYYTNSLKASVPNAPFWQSAAAFRDNGAPESEHN